MTERSAVNCQQLFQATTNFSQLPNKQPTKLHKQRYVTSDLENNDKK